MFVILALKIRGDQIRGEKNFQKGTVAKYYIKKKVKKYLWGQEISEKEIKNKQKSKRQTKRISEGQRTQTEKWESTIKE